MTPGPVAARPPLTITLFCPGLLRSRLNGSGSRAHWSVISRGAAAWRTRVTLAWIAAGHPVWAGSAAVTFTAYVGRLWDDDNLPAAIKPVRDQAVQHILGTSDGPRSGHTFTYRQEVRPASERGVRIEVTPK